MKHHFSDSQLLAPCKSRVLRLAKRASVNKPRPDRSDRPVVGHGLLAQAFLRQAERIPVDAVVCAAGVSDSSSADIGAFEREEKLIRSLIDALDGQRLVYFSSISVTYESQRPYENHKRAMEAIVRGAGRYAIMRLPHVVGVGANPATITEYLYSCIRDDQEFDLWTGAWRSLIDVDDVVRITCQLLAEGNSDALEQTIEANWLRVEDIVSIFEAVLGKKASYRRVERGQVPSSSAQPRPESVLQALDLKFDRVYTEQLIEKYYAPSAREPEA